MNKLIEQLKRHEGYRQFVYECSAGYPTIGFGRRLDKGGPGVGVGEAESMLWKDASMARAELAPHMVFQSLDEIRQDALVNMCFNLGLPGLLKFKKMWAALAREDFKSAAVEMLDSRWSDQVGQRSFELAEQMITGKYMGDE